MGLRLNDLSRPLNAKRLASIAAAQAFVWRIGHIGYSRMRIGVALPITMVSGALSVMVAVERVLYQFFGVPAVFVPVAGRFAPFVSGSSGKGFDFIIGGGEGGVSSSGAIIAPPWAQLEQPVLQPPLAQPPPQPPFPHPPLLQKKIVSRMPGRRAQQRFVGGIVLG
jgi:hypothetical protein